MDFVKFSGAPHTNGNSEAPSENRNLNKNADVFDER